MGWCIQKQNYSTRTTIIVTISIKILAVNFCKYILDNSKWDKIIEVIAKTHIWHRVRHSLKSKKIIRNQIFISELWYIGQIYTIPKYQKGN